jgi:hypothetical protein
MSLPLPLLFILLIALGIYWFVTQILPERQRAALLRPAVAMGLLGTLNERRHAQGQAILELDEELALVAERKVLHQLTTGDTQGGWEYPSHYAGMLGLSLLMEALITGPAETMATRLSRQPEIFDDEWVRCGIAAAAAEGGRIVVALVLCREAWEPATEEVPLLSYEY